MQVMSFALYKKFVNSSSFIHVHQPLMDHIAQRYDLISTGFVVYRGLDALLFHDDLHRCDVSYCDAS
jgi:hypothetical protein